MKKIVFIIVLLLLAGCNEETLGDIQVTSTIDVTSEDIRFTLSTDVEDAVIKEVKVLSSNHDIFKDVELTEEFYVDGFLSNTEYYIEVKIVNTELDQFYNPVLIPFKTEEKELPSIIVAIEKISYTGVEYSYFLIDPDYAGYLEEVNLYLDGILVETNNTETSFENLLYSTEYQLEFVYVYDLNDGTGSKELLIDEYIETKDPLIDYFTEVALGFETGGASEVTRKWYEPMILYYYGDYSDELEDELYSIIEELNSYFSDGFHITTTSKKEDANAILYFGNGYTYADKYNIPYSVIDNNWGLFNVWFYGNIIEDAEMFVDTERPDFQGQKHILREELTQALGFGQDSWLFEDSIFYQGWNPVTEYSDLDVKLIKLLYSNDVTVNWNEDFCRENLPEIIEDLFN